MKKAILAVSALFLLGVMGEGAAFAQSARKHAALSVADVAVAPVVHPKRTFKQILGSVVFLTENAVDVVHFGLDALDKSTATELKAFNYVIHPADVVAAKADSGLEAAEQYFFGTSN